ncbi:MAG: hypothetical protein U5L07_14630 [Desulfobacterales bacterium]|nr:hypothetical protein [Desulfobacterales bacterium]
MQLRITCFKVFGENDIFLAGHQLGGPQYFAKRYNGSAWTNVTSGGSLVDFLDVAVSGTDVYVISDRIWDDDMESYLGYPGIIGGDTYTGGGKNFKAVALADDGKVYAVGKAGAIVSYSGGSWSAENSHTTKDLTCVAAGGGWVCAAGRDRTVVCKNDGSTWQAVTNLSEKAENKFVGIAWSGGETFVAIHNTGNDGEQSYIGADKGTIYKIEAGAASLLRTGMSSSLGGIGSDSEGKVAIGGSGGIVYGNALPLSEENKGIHPGIYMLLLD